MFRLLMQLLPFLMQGQKSGDGQSSNPNPFGAPFANPFGEAASQPASDGPIDVEAEVEGEEEQAAEARRKWDKQRGDSTHQLAGDVVFQGSKTYNIICAVASFLALLGGFIWRVYTLVQGNIFSSVVVPVALGAIGAVVVSLVCGILFWRLGKERVPYLMIDLVFLFFSSAVMGYANLLAFALSLVVAYLYQRFGKKGKLPLLIPFVIFAVIEFFVLGFPGLMR